MNKEKFKTLLFIARGLIREEQLKETKYMAYEWEKLYNELSPQVFTNVPPEILKSEPLKSYIFYLISHILYTDEDWEKRNKQIYSANFANSNIPKCLPPMLKLVN